jgi:hypothetical protein
MKIIDKNTNVETMKEVTAEHDEGIRPDTTYEGVSQIKPGARARARPVAARRR